MGISCKSKAEQQATEYIYKERYRQQNPFIVFSSNYTCLFSICTLACTFTRDLHYYFIIPHSFYPLDAQL